MTLKLKHVRPGDIVITDAGFTCMAANKAKVVRRGKSGLFIQCREGGHYLNGQLGDRGELIGLRRPTLTGGWLP